MTKREKIILKEKAALTILQGFTANPKIITDKMIWKDDSSKNETLSKLAIAVTTLAEEFVKQLEMEEE